MYIYTHPRYETASELRSILNLMEERSHLGLDSEIANKIGDVLRRKIEDRENTSSKKRAPSLAVAAEEQKFLA
jgi:hypothetical protein